MPEAGSPTEVLPNGHRFGRFQSHKSLLGWEHMEPAHGREEGLGEDKHSM